MFIRHIGCERFNASESADVNSGLDAQWAVRCPTQGDVVLTVFGQVCVCVCVVRGRVGGVRTGRC